MNESPNKTATQQPHPLPLEANDDPALQRIRHKLVRLMLASIIITFVLLGLVFLAVIYKIMQPTTQAVPVQSTASPSLQTSPARTLIEQRIDLPPKSHVLAYTVSGDIITLQIHNPGAASELVLYNYRLGQKVARLYFPADAFAVPVATSATAN